MISKALEFAQTPHVVQGSGADAQFAVPQQQLSNARSYSPNYASDPFMNRR